MRLRGARDQVPASAMVRTFAPRGTQYVDDRMRAVARQRAEGATRIELAKFYGVTVETISHWCAKVRAADEDARNLRGRAEPAGESHG
ncbi:MAG TPA: hypothetical protein VKU41_04840 [Polyangiaceae bacterium]|nr:hypothetical protein [Polyangiaceae bacterium]